MRALPHTTIAIVVLLAGGCGTDEEAVGPHALGTLEVAPSRLLDADEPPEALSSAAIDALVATAAERVRSETITGRVARRFDLHLDTGFMGEDGRADGATAEEASRRLHERLTVERREGSLALDVSVADDDPERATSLCNAALEAAVEESLERRAAPLLRRSEWLSEQLDQVRERREQAEGPEAERLDALIDRLTDEATEIHVAQQRQYSDAPLTVLNRCHFSRGR